MRTKPRLETEFDLVLAVGRVAIDGESWPRPFLWTVAEGAGPWTGDTWPKVNVL